MITKRSFAYFAFIHIFFLLLISTISTVEAYEKSTSFVENEVTKRIGYTKTLLSKSTSIPIIQQYLSLSGIEAGYSFFAPNVASSYILKTTIYNRKNGKKEQDYFFPPFKTREGKNRYHTFLGSFQDRLKILENDVKKKKSNLFRESKEYGEYLDIYIKSVGRFYYKQYDPDRFSVHCILYLHNYPKLSQSSAENNNSTLIKLLELDANKLNK